MDETVAEKKKRGPTSGAAILKQIDVRFPGASKHSGIVRALAEKTEEELEDALWLKKQMAKLDSEDRARCDKFVFGIAPSEKK